ncbi:unnamed protein product [Phaedon cochleariae]|uniref:Cation/H+ exchanger transmembrane domain-containing protein n=1 Tax=Phaedon cochleariae TaxID=80249 RepID=A0A9N9X162_PHACE|nr:unnamed protein product [Phaedon cochleariae]
MLFQEAEEPILIFFKIDMSASSEHFPSVVSHPQPDLSRVNSRVSVATGGHDNPGFESPSRKVSSSSEHAEIGPVRKKSILHKSSEYFDHMSGSGKCEHGKQMNGDTHFKKHSVCESVHSRARFSDTTEPRSWWYIFCLRCRSKEDPSSPSWQPSFWPKLCPHPFCLSYRQFTRIISLTLIGLLTWCILYAMIGPIVAPPSGKLFQLMVLSISAHLGGWLISLTTLPALIGMLFTGLLLQNVNIVDIDENFAEICKELRNVALVIILIRAGLDLDPSAMRRMKYTVIKLGLVPWLMEAFATALLSVFLLDLPVSYALLLGSLVAAVSPAVVVTCLFRLRSKGYGVAKGIPTLIIAVSGIDDAVSVAIFGIIKSIMFSSSSLTSLIIEGPISIVGGIGFGVLWGMFCNYSPEKNDPFVIPLRILLLLVGGMVAVFGSEVIGYGGAGPLGCVAAAFVSLVCWSRQGWDIADNPAATAFEIFWMIFEPILFGITGASIRLDRLDGGIVSVSVGILVAVALIRIAGTVLLGIGCKLNLKEKIFVAISWMSKATVQAALGPAVLGMVAAQSKEHEYGDKILTTCVLSIMLTAPTGAILITLLGPRLLTKTKYAVEPEQWRRSHRPSIRDISIIDEEEEREDTSVEKKEIDETGSDVILTVPDGNLKHEV